MRSGLVSAVMAAVPGVACATSWASESIKGLIDAECRMLDSDERESSGPWSEHELTKWLKKKTGRSYNDLRKKKALNLSKTGLEFLPRAIGSLPGLERLNLSGNAGLTSLPRETWDLTRLTVLNLSRTGLVSLSEEIEKLGNLATLNLSGTRLVSLPEEIGNLSGLVALHLSGVAGLRSLPASAGNLVHSMRCLDLSNNPGFEEYGMGDTLGWRPLEAMLGNHVLLPSSIIVRPPKKAGIEEVYERMGKQPIHWCVSRLKEIREDPVPEHALGMEGLLGLFRELQEKLGKYPDGAGADKKVPDGGIVERYIKMLYEPETVGICEICPVGKESVGATKNRLEALLRRMVEKVDRQEAEDVKVYLPVMIEGMKCWRAERLWMAYWRLYGTEDGAGSLEHLVEQQIAYLKSYILQVTVIPGRGSQMSHIWHVPPCWSWRSKLRNELGLEEEFVPSQGRMGHHMFGGSPENVLGAFYQKFTPLYVARELAGLINEEQTRVDGAGAFLMEGMNVKDKGARERLESMFEFANDQDREGLVYLRINDRGAEGILLKMGLLVRNEEAEGPEERQRPGKVAVSG